MRHTAGALLVGLTVVAAGIAVAMLRVNPYLYFAGYVILQYVVIATAWNILGGYAGYVNFGTPAFFALGAYTAVVLIQSTRAPLPVLILAGGLVSGLLGLGIGYLTLRLRGVFFSIATLALSIVLQTMIINWEYVGGSRGLSVIRPSGPPFGSYVTFLFTVMVLLSVVAVTVARFIERSWIGVAGAPFPYYVTFVEPNSAFNLDYAVNALAMPMIGGTTSWVGPVIGAVLLGTAQQLATVTISSEMNLFIVGVVLVAFVVLAPEGIVGLVRRGPGGGRPPVAPPFAGG